MCSCEATGWCDDLDLKARDASARASSPADIQHCLCNSVIYMQVERELERSKKELKREMDQARIIAEQDHAHRARFELCKKKITELANGAETMYGMTTDLEESTARMQVA
jgi:hypothetical protein